MKKLCHIDTEIEDKKLKGVVEYKCLKNSDRLKYLDSSGIDLSTGKPTSSEITFTAELMDLAAARIETVKLDFDGAKVTKKQDLEYFGFGMAVLSQVATEILQGPTLGKK